MFFFWILNSAFRNTLPTIFFRCCSINEVPNAKVGLFCFEYFAHLKQPTNILKVNLVWLVGDEVFFNAFFNCTISFFFSLSKEINATIILIKEYYHRIYLPSFINLVLFGWFFHFDLSIFMFWLGNDSLGNFTNQSHIRW